VEAITVREVQGSFHPTIQGVAQIVLPENGIFSYDNHLVAIENNAWEFNFVLSGGNRTNLYINSPNARIACIEPENSIIRKIVVNYDQRDYTTGFKFFNEDGFILLQSGTFGYTDFTINLEVGERIVGVKSRLFSNGTARHSNVIFVLGKPE